jgi:hypothetical protein
MILPKDGALKTNNFYNEQYKFQLPEIFVFFALDLYI